MVVLVISVRSRGGAVPVAWKGLHATSKQLWQPEGVALLAHCPQVVPRGGTVLVRAARGVSARWLFHALVAVGWHPRRRIHQPGQCRPHGWYHWVPVTTLVPRVGRRWAGPGIAFTGKDTPLACTLLGGWDAGHQDAWLVLPDLPPPAAQACW